MLEFNCAEVVTLEMKNRLWVDVWVRRPVTSLTLAEVRCEVWWQCRKKGLVTAPRHIKIERAEWGGDKVSLRFSVRAFVPSRPLLSWEQSVAEEAATIFGKHYAWKIAFPVWPSWGAWMTQIPFLSKGE